MEDEERRSLRGGERGGLGILLLTLVSQLNPLAGAINILVMMSDESPRAEEADQKRTCCFRIMRGGRRRKGGKESEREKSARDE